MKIRKLRKDDGVVFGFTIEGEDTPLKGNVLASGDEEEDRLAEQHIHDALRRGNQWAWCCIRVTARWQGFTGVDSLGCCSFASREDFALSGELEHMEECALHDLNAQLQAMVEKLSKLEVGFHD